MNPTTQNEVDEIDQAVFEFAVGREKTVPPHIRTALIESQPSVIKLKTAITKLILEARIDTVEPLVSHNEQVVSAETLRQLIENYKSQLQELDRG